LELTLWTKPANDELPNYFAFRISHFHSSRYFTLIQYGDDGIPFAITNNWLSPVSAPDGTSNWVETFLFPVAMAMVLWLWVRQ